MKPFVTAIKAMLFVFFGAICFDAQAQSMRIDSRGEQTIQQPKAENSTFQPSSNITAVNVDENDEVETLYVRLEQKLSHLLASSDIDPEGRNMIQVVMDQYNLPTTSFSNLEGPALENIQVFTNQFTPDGYMDDQLLRIFSLLRSASE